MDYFSVVCYTVLKYFFRRIELCQDRVVAQEAEAAHGAEASAAVAASAAVDSEAADLDTDPRIIIITDRDFSSGVPEDITAAAVLEDLSA